MPVNQAVLQAGAPVTDIAVYESDTFTGESPEIKALLNQYRQTPEGAREYLEDVKGTYTQISTVGVRFHLRSSGMPMAIDPNGKLISFSFFRV